MIRPLRMPTIEVYRHLSGIGQSLVDVLAMPDVEAADFEPSRLDGPFPFRPSWMMYLLDTSLVSELRKARTELRPLGTGAGRHGGLC